VKKFEGKDGMGFWRLGENLKGRERERERERERIRTKKLKLES
jgi:hypothetical protein